MTDPSGLPGKIPLYRPATKSQEPTDPSSRTIVLCFDGTGNKFGTHNSNVVRFFKALVKTQPDKQIVYYQAGIGTYLKRQFMTKTVSRIASTVDSAIALNLGEHVKDGYTFLMQNYRIGDKICLFGFSRGAYTARALAGMVYKIGLLPADNIQQVDFAFTVYNTTSKKDANLARQFKDVFSIPVKIDFLGVWDTVSSVGIIPRTLPYSSQNDGVKVFRHALALDECRARFRPNVWGEPAVIREELDTIPDIPERKDTPRDEWVYQPPAITDVKEVWFAGCHADIGGGSHGDEVDTSLSKISLRWMVKECFLMKTGIIFDTDRLEAFGLLKLKDLESSDPGTVPTYTTLAASSTSPPAPISSPQSTSVVDAFADIYNQLHSDIGWWVLEAIPMLITYQQGDGSWLRSRIRNFGLGRYLPYAGNEILVHRSVKARIDAIAYTPAARNWKQALNSGMINWVDVGAD